MKLCRTLLIPGDYNKRKKKFPKEYDDIVSLLKQCKSYQEISELLGLTYNRVAYIINKYKLKRGVFPGLSEGQVWLVGYEDRYFGTPEGKIFSVLKGYPVEMAGSWNANGYKIFSATDQYGVMENKFFHKELAKIFGQNTTK